MQSSFEVVGFFSVKVTPIGANLCLLEDNKEGFLEAIISEGSVWLGRWFAEVRKWKYEDVDLERVTWLRCYGIPCHAWVFSFFEFLASTVGTYICSEEDTIQMKCMYVDSIMVRTICGMLINEVLNINFNGVIFRIILVEDSMGHSRVVIVSFAWKKVFGSSSESEDSGWEEDGGGGGDEEDLGVDFVQLPVVADGTFTLQKGVELMGSFVFHFDVEKFSPPSLKKVFACPNTVGNCKIDIESNEVSSHSGAQVDGIKLVKGVVSLEVNETIGVT